MKWKYFISYHGEGKDTKDNNWTNKYNDDPTNLQYWVTALERRFKELETPRWNLDVIYFTMEPNEIEKLPVV